MSNASTIFALSSGPGKAGVAVIRVSGPAVQAVLERMAPPLPEPRQAVFRSVRHPESGAVLDRAIVLFFAAPRSETGEDVAEFQVHGGRAVVTAVLGALAQVSGCRLAEPGEFARRAFTNGKLDLAEVEGLADLIDAETEAQRRQALGQAQGALSKLYEGWRSQLIEIAALTEAAIDFSDEGDVGTSTFAAARKRAAPLLAEIQAHLRDGRRGEILRDGFRVALLGPPNAGKSSLLNALAQRDAAIVSEEAGTTRDVIEVRLDLGGYPVIVSDTAGLREAAGSIEQEGMRRSLAAARSADLVLWLTETGADEPPDSIRDSVSRETAEDTHASPVWVVRTKADLAPIPSPRPYGERVRVRGSKPTSVSGISPPEQAAAPHPNPLPTPSEGAWGEGAIAISSKTGFGVADLVAAIGEQVAAGIGDQTAPALTQERHRSNLEAAAGSLEHFLAGDATAIELRAEDVRRAAQCIGRITGRVDVEDVLDQIFSRFCIGK